MSKLLIGVAHADEYAELNKVKSLVGSPLIAGLELPEDYQEKEELGVTVFFFSKLAHYLRKNNAKIVALEKAELVNCFYAVDGARKVLNGSMAMEDLENRLKLLDTCVNPYAAPKQSYAARLRAQRYWNIVRVLDAVHSLDEVLMIWNELNTRREEYMIKKIQQYQPDMVVVGYAHAHKLAGILKDYNYTISF